MATILACNSSDCLPTNGSRSAVIDTTRPADPSIRMGVERRDCCRQLVIARVDLPKNLRCTSIVETNGWLMMQWRSFPIGMLDRMGLVLGCSMPDFGRRHRARWLLLCLRMRRSLLLLC
jgi:hypothetical protein